MRSKKSFSFNSKLAALTIALAGFLIMFLTMPSFAASQAKKKGVSFSLSGQYIARGFFAQNQSQFFGDVPSIYQGEPVLPSNNTFQSFTQRLRLSASVSYGSAGMGMPLVSVLTQFDLTNDYNGNTTGYGTNGWYTLGYNPAPIGFNHDFNTFGLREAYLRLVTPAGMWMVGRMPVKFGMGVAVNTEADGLGDFLPFQTADLGVFLGVLFGNETVAPPSGTVLPYTTSPAVVYPPASYYYTHIQMGTIPTLELMTLKPVMNMSFSLWLTEAHLSQFNTTPTTENGGFAPSANITFGGLSATYANAGTKIAGELDYFAGNVIPANYVANTGRGVFINGIGPGKTQIHSYDIYLTGSTMLPTSIPMSAGLKIGIGSPMADSMNDTSMMGFNTYDMTYYSMIQNTRTLFGDVLGSNWQPIQMATLGTSDIYGPALGSNLANKWAIMGDLTQHFAGNNSLEESLMYMAWLRTSASYSSTQLVPGFTTNTTFPMFGGRDIGTEFDLNFTHHFTKTLAWQAWASYVWTGAGVESFNNISGGTCTVAGTTISCGGWTPSITANANIYNPTHKNVTALGTAIIWNF